MALLAVSALAASNVEGNAANISHFDKFHGRANANDFASDFVPENDARLRRRATAKHVNIGPANVGRNDLETKKEKKKSRQE